MERKYQVIELSLLNKREFWEMLTLNFDRFYISPEAGVFAFHYPHPRPLPCYHRNQTPA